jgi:hypothetical protein
MARVRPTLGTSNALPKYAHLKAFRARPQTDLSAGGRLVALAGEAPMNALGTSALASVAPERRLSPIPRGVVPEAHQLSQKRTRRAITSHPPRLRAETHERWSPNVRRAVGGQAAAECGVLCPAPIGRPYTDFRGSSHASLRGSCGLPHNHTRRRRLRLAAAALSGCHLLTRCRERMRNVQVQRQSRSSRCAFTRSMSGDRHLLLGARENHSRPAIRSLFRSAAVARRGRVEAASSAACSTPARRGCSA